MHHTLLLVRCVFTAHPLAVCNSAEPATVHKLSHHACCQSGFPSEFMFRWFPVSCQVFFRRWFLWDEVEITWVLTWYLSPVPSSSVRWPVRVPVGCSCVWQPAEAMAGCDSSAAAMYKPCMAFHCMASPPPCVACSCLGTTRSSMLCSGGPPCMLG